MPLVKPLTPSAVPYCKLCFSTLSLSPFHNNASFALVFFDFFRLLGVDGFCRCCSKLSARARPRLRMWTRTISGFSEVDIATSQITTALISAKNDAKKCFFWNKFSTLDVPYSCPLCSRGSYFGEASALLSNLLSLLHMKVSGWSTEKKE